MYPALIDSHNTRHMQTVPHRQVRADCPMQWRLSMNVVGHQIIKRYKKGQSRLTTITKLAHSDNINIMQPDLYEPEDVEQPDDYILNPTGFRMVSETLSFYPLVRCYKLANTGRSTCNSTSGMLECSGNDCKVICGRFNFNGNLPIKHHHLHLLSVPFDK